MKRLHLPTFCAVLLAFPAHALTDTNSNSLSDYWETLFNNGQLFLTANPDHAPTADPDGDGSNNLREATAGTDPFDPQPPSGIIVPEIEVTPATFEPLPPGSEPPPAEPPPEDPFSPSPVTPGPERILLDPPLVRLTWPTVPGKAYEVKISTDLDLWSPASGGFVGSGIPLTYETEPLHEDGTVPDKLFWRVEVGDTDSDGDTLTDYEEILRGLDPLSVDSDSDGLPDNTDPDPLVNSLQIVWDDDATDPAAGELFASFNFTPSVGTYPSTAERVTDISGNSRHGKALTPLGFFPPPQNPPQENAEGIANNGFHCGNNHHFAFDVKNPGLNFNPVKSLSFWFRAKAADFEGGGQPVFSYVPKEAVYGEIGNSVNTLAARAFVRKQATGGSYEIIWFDWSAPVNQARERWELDLTESQLDGNWVNLTFVWQGSGAGADNLWACYANGVKQNRTHESVHRFQITASAPNTLQDTFLIGADAAGGSGANNQANVGQTFNGSFDRVRFYTSELDAAQVMAITAQDTDNDGLWDATEMNSTAWKDINSNGRRDPGEIFHPFVHPLLWQQADTDTDSDELTDIFEQNITRTIFHDHDTDNDLLPDGWEYQNNLDPLSSIGDDGIDGDPDGDGVDNFDEWRYLSNPRATHSDGDGVADGIEIGQGSDPGDTADNGQAPPPEEKLVMKITVGDPSDSHSERWRVEAVDVETGKTVLRHASRQYGQLSAEAESVFDRFKPGRAYAFRLRHAGTDPDKLDADPEGEDLPDYDWSLVISYQNEQGEYISLASPAQSEYLVIDPYDNDTNALSPDTPFLLAPAYPFATIGAGRDARPAYREKILPMSVVMLPLAITSDANRDGVIDFADRKQVTPEKPWRFWTNDDDDSGATGGTDIPQDPASKGTNGYDHKVNGVRDLVDFFPLDLNLTAALKICPQRKYSYKITHDAPQTPPCFKIVQARDLEAADSGAYLEDLDTALATDGLESAPIHSHGRNLDSRFLDAQEDGNGLLLVEAIRPTTDPIRLRIIRNSDQQVMVETAFHVSVTPALDMIRWKFVSPGAADITAAQIPGDPANWPDEDRNGKHFVWVHGYNVNPDQSKGWGTEAFKRMFWSGSNARFTAFAWYGYQSQTPFDIQGGPKTPNYQVNLLHAFGTAKSFKQFLDLLEGEKTVAAHSMGNIVVGSAMHDWGVRPKNYIMLNSAAAKECYDGTEADNADQDTRMVYPAWAAYDKELRASEWHKLAWPENDKRRTLTWRNRLRGVIDNGGLTDVYNFYSSGEEVLNNPETNNPSIDPTNPFGISGLLWTTGNKTWAIQEKRKGYGLTGVVHTSNYGGWLPNLLPYHVDLHVTASGPWGTHRMRTQAELPPATDAAWLAKLKTRPFFNTSNHPELYDAQTGAGSTGSDYAQQHRNTLIAEMIPCTTFAAGRNGFLSTITGLPTNRQIDMNTAMKTDPMRWPLSNANENDAPPNNPDSRPWVHSDIREKAFVHNRNAYEKFVVIGNLNQTE